MAPLGARQRSDYWESNTKASRGRETNRVRSEVEAARNERWLYQRQDEAELREGRCSCWWRWRGRRARAEAAVDRDECCDTAPIASRLTLAA